MIAVTGLAPDRHDTLSDTPAPSENPRLVGHEAIATSLANDYRTGRLHHALLLAGPAGIGKATLAFRIANHLLAHPDAAGAPADLSDPDTSSSTFRQVASDAHPSVLHLTRPLNEKTKGFKTAITADEVRRINRFLAHTSHDRSWRVVIVDPADDMNRNAANALLKNLEEPPARTLFILVAHQPGRLLPTIRSRCRLVRLSPLGMEDLRAAIAAVRPDLGSLSSEALQRAGGSVREALLDLAYGGQEIADAMQGVLGARRLDIPKLHALADQVAGRTAGLRYELFLSRLLERIAEEAAQAADEGRGRQADELASLFQDTTRATDTADAYNLDRKQHVIGTVTRVHAVLATGTPSR